MASAIGALTRVAVEKQAAFGNAKTLPNDCLFPILSTTLAEDYDIEYPHRKTGYIGYGEGSLTKKEVAGDIALALSRIEEEDYRRKSEAMRQETEEKYRLHFENISDVIFSYDDKFTILDVSPSVERVIGYKPEELVGKSFSEANLMTEDSLKLASANAKRALSGEKTSPTEYIFISKGGMEKFVEITSAPLYRDGEIIVACE